MSSKSSKKQPSEVGQPAGPQPSEAWAYFDRIVDNFDVICKQKDCRKVIARKDSKQTGDMWKHLEQKHEDLYKKTEHFQGRDKPATLDLEKVRMTTRSSKNVVKEDAVEYASGSARTRPIGESDVSNITVTSSKLEDSKIVSLRKTRKRAAAAPEPTEVKATAESSEPKKKQSKSGDSSEPKKTQADGSSEPKSKMQTKSNDSSEPKKTQADGSSEPKTKEVKTDDSSEPNMKKQPKSNESSEPKNKQSKTDDSSEPKKPLRADDSSGSKKKQPKTDDKSYESRLIAAVRRQPGLYDQQHSDYARKSAKVALWTTVASEIGATDKQANADWRALRDKFAKQLRRLKEEGKDATWPPYDEMSFLEPFIHCKKKHEGTSGSMETAEDQPQDEDDEDEEEDEGEEDQNDAPTFDDLVVAQVQRFPCLYDTTHEDYGSMKKKKEAWSLVGKALKKSIHDVSYRWNLLRANFARKVKRAEGDARELLKEHKLAFLIPFLKHSAVGETATTDEGHALLEDMPEVTVEIGKFDEDKEDDDEADQDSIDSDDDSLAGTEEDDDEEDDASEADENDVPEDAMNGAEVAVKKQGQRSAAPPLSAGSPRKPGPSKLEEYEEESDSDDEDELFLRTLRCKFRKMDEATKERTKAKLMDTIVDVKYGPK